MAVVHSPESEYSKEMERWNTPKRLGGFRPNGYEAFPKMLYRALPNPLRGQKVMCGDVPNDLPADMVTKVEEFSRTCQLIVGNEYERDRAINDGWYTSPDAALEGYEKEQQAISTAAAEANFHAVKMSGKAQAERKAREAASGVAQVPD